MKGNTRSSVDIEIEAILRLFALWVRRGRLLDAYGTVLGGVLNTAKWSCPLRRAESLRDGPEVHTQPGINMLWQRLATERGVDGCTCKLPVAGQIDRVVELSA